MIRTCVALPALALLAAACGSQDSASDTMTNFEDAAAEAGPQAADPAGGAAEPAAPATETPELNEADDAGSEQPSPPDTPESRMIPDQYRGRWGMVEADCDRERSDAKGHILIGERTIAFYESRATLRERRPAVATAFSGLFAFTGEGQQWEKVMTLSRDGDRLTRSDSDGSYSYRRCR